MSALLTTTMPAMKTTIEAFAHAGIRQRVKILVGGAPISQRFAEEIGADGYSDSAVGAVNLARKMAA
jgi:5-methyltetrahydrofolate--homocysteine methyltransferase